MEGGRGDWSVLIELSVNIMEFDRPFVSDDFMVHSIPICKVYILFSFDNVVLICDKCMYCFRADELN